MQVLTTYFNRTATTLKRLDKGTTPPIFSFFAETLSGLPLVRAYRLQHPFLQRLTELIDDNHRPHLLWTASSRWLAVRID